MKVQRKKETELPEIEKIDKKAIANAWKEGSTVHPEEQVAYDTDQNNPNESNNEAIRVDGLYPDGRKKQKD